MAGEKTVEQLKAELSAVVSENSELKSQISNLTQKNEELTAEIEHSVSEILSLQNQLEKAKQAQSGEVPTVVVEEITYRIEHGGSAFEHDGEKFEKFTIKDIQENEDLAKALVEIGFGGLELISND